MSIENEQLVFDEEEEDTTKDQYLTFDIDEETYGIEIANVKEIIGVSTVSITKVPDTPVYLKGIMNLRGDIIPVIDVRTRFMKPERPYDELTCIVVIVYGNYIIGLIVDNVREVMHIDESNVFPPPNAKLNRYNQFIRNIGMTDGNINLLLDLDRFLEQD
ncbi:MAG: chemotaxis protein CheW [Clostridiales bacterium]|jgi:purine-binding chemotaxis protein CheW|nr:chemotaxis protein CheW [Clostridiales bacterium]